LNAENTRVLITAYDFAMPIPPDLRLVA